MKKMGKRCLATLLVISSLFIESVNGNLYHVQATENELPFTFEETNYGVVDENVKAKKLLLTDDDVEIIDVNEPDMLLLRENTTYGTVKVYVVGVNGLAHTYEVESDSEWLNNLYDETAINKTFRNLYMAPSYEEKYNDNVHLYETEYHLEDSIITIKSPYTDKMDLINLSTSQYYEYNCDSVTVINKEFIAYRIDGKIGIADRHGKKITDAIYDNYYQYGDDLTCYYSDSEKNGEVLITANGMFDGSYLYGSVSVYDGYALATKDSGFYYYLDIETGVESRILDTAYTFEVNNIQGFGESKPILMNSFMEEKAYLVKGDQMIDLNTSLGGTYCNATKLASNYIIYRTSDSWGNYNMQAVDYFYASAYNIVQNSQGQNEKEYCYQGVVDEYGNPIYGYDSPDYVDTHIRWYDNGYMIVEDTTAIVEGEYGAIKVIDTNGKVYYQTTSHCNKVDAVSITDNYMAFHLDKNNLSVLIDLETGEVTEFEAYFIKVDDKWKFNGEQYVWIYYSGNKARLQNLSTGKFFDFYGIANGHYEPIKDFVISNDGKHALIYMDNVEISLDQFMPSGAILNENLELVYGDDVDYINLDLSFSDDGKIYNMYGNIILENCHNNVVDIENEYLIRVGTGEKIYNRTYTYCDFNGELLLDYIFDSASNFSKGLACGYIEDEEQTIIINSNNETIVEENYSERFNGYYNNAMNGHGIILEFDGEYYFYDFTDVERKEYSSEQVSLNEDEINEKNKLLANAEKINDFKFTGMNTEITLPQEIPVIGGEKIKMDFSLVPILFEKSGNTFRAGIGMNFKSDTGSLYDLTASEWNNAKKAIEKGKSNIAKGKNLLLASQFGNVALPATKDLKADVYGYIEGVIENGAVKSSNGTIKIKFTFSVDKKWQTVVVSVPVVISAELEAGVECIISVGLDWENCNLVTNGTVEFTLPKVRLSAGVGVAYVADVSVYGEMENILQFSQGVGTSEARVRDYLDGEMGVGVYTLLFQHEKTLWNGKRKIVFDSADGIVKTLGVDDDTLELTLDNFSILRADAGTWMSETEASTSTNSITVLQENVYAEANPEIISTDSGLKMMVYTADDNSRTTGNQTVLMYSLYNEEENTWDEPKYIEDDGTADFYPETVTDGNDIYITWMDADSNAFSSSSTLEEVAASCEINVAKYDAEENRFVDIVTLTENSYADIRPSLAALDGKIYVVWSANRNNDLINLSGTNEIYYGIWDGASWTKCEASYDTIESPVKTACIGVIDDSIKIMYTIDEDGDVGTISDAKIYIGNLEEKAIGVFSERSDIVSAEFNKIGTQNVLMLSTQDGLYCTNDLINLRCLLESDKMFSEYHVVNGTSNNLIIGSAVTEEGSNIFAHIVTEDSISDAIPFTTQDAYIRHPNGFYESGNYYLTFTKSSYLIDSQDEFHTSTDICCMKFRDYTDLSVEDVGIDEENIVPGETCEVTVHVKNNGTQSINSYKVSVKIGDVVVAEENITENLESGAAKEVVMNIDFPAELQTSDIICEVLPVECDDINTGNNIFSRRIGQTNLQLNTFKVATDESYAIHTYVKNDSGFVSNAMLNIHDTSQEGEILYSADLGTINPGKLRKLVISSDVIDDISDLNSVLYFEVCSEQEESSVSDNYSFIYNEEVLIDYISFEKSYISFDKIGEQKQIEVEIVPDNATNKVLTFTSTNPAIATVTENGLVEAKSNGETQIIVKTNDGSLIEKVCYIIVSESNETVEEENVVENNPSNDTFAEDNDKSTAVNQIGVGDYVQVGVNQYKVTVASASSKTLAYVKTKNKNKTSVTIPATVKIDGNIYKVTEIAANAFENNKKLKTVIVGKNVKRIGKQAFYNCVKLKKITIKSTVLKSIGKNSIKNIYKKAVIKVPKKQLRKYKKLFRSKTGYKTSMTIRK